MSLLSKIFSGLLLLTVAFIWQAEALAVNIDNPLDLAFVADKQENLIDVIDLKKGKVVFSIETEFPADQLVVSPYAPTLLYTNSELKAAVFYDLSKQKTISRIELPMVPRHLVMDSTGLKAGASDINDGGFALFSMTARELLFSIEGFPATADMLFDPNDVEAYYTNQKSGSLGVLNLNTQNFVEIALTDSPDQLLSAPSRSLDGRQIYVANKSQAEVYNINSFSKVVFKSFNTDSSPTRPYTTPQGAFLYLMDDLSGRLTIVDQGSFRNVSDQHFEAGIDAVAVGRFDRFNLFISTANSRYYFYDNLKNQQIDAGEFDGQPLSILGSADGRTAYVAFSNLAKVAMIDLENQAVRYFPAVRTGAGAFTIGLSNNVCH
jgi:DNA-binding beta-propeller fold protein YncE